MPANAVRSVSSNQDDIYRNLEAVVRKYAATTFLRPIAEHTRESFAIANKFIESFAAGNTLVLDSGCGTGESTIHLAKKFPGIPVIGTDKSAVRLSKAQRGDIPPNAIWIRAELIDFWRLALEKVMAGEWNVIHHALYYPNPWPKESEATRRFHLHPIFPTLLKLSPVTELRTNWEIYAREFAEAARIASDALPLKLSAECSSFAPAIPETAFERKYKEADQKLYRVLVRR
ncbi:methyltransferase domain-containing protein [uncultured Fibrobacter sp.]|uniref:methyltransferase domain-containing protein n=1 Tax=uncultured Fibrobacter sp. TaxID=261512 RepID=UPI002601B5CD|nr:methyltransferase domain-containing protein [uncultured Fibrobacter sp.]